MKRRNPPANVIASRLTPGGYLTCWLALMFLVTPLTAQAAWYDPLVKFAQEFRTALIIIGGVVAVSSLVYVGVCWIISRMAGTMDTTMMDYMKHVGVIGAVGGAVSAATWAYSLWGGAISG
ncbi:MULTISPECIES: hypothetical protein [unclassified Sodalis]|uniref:hypothetical protein n=1 Tax=Sodalis TaxID=84565 RepID=UPI00093A71E9|nr:hypothetical protein [Candidatus Sodalis sp. SoCistrobi]